MNLICYGVFVPSFCHELNVQKLIISSFEILKCLYNINDGVYIDIHCSLFL